MTTQSAAAVVPMWLPSAVVVITPPSVILPEALNVAALSVPVKVGLATVTYRVSLGCR